ncbi:sigma-70 family RNA polymerase sigma factor [Sphingomonas sp. ST-64]|uniref:Sigma-70 family RNA polymerase sigma factor n=1 Tax=Sphingomonas plantiphila TaxID=3163295 RepID=A0ABW8YKV9_9SPHN
MSRRDESSFATDTGLAQLLGEIRADLSRFLVARQCEPAEVDDLLQELYVKVTGARTGPIGHPRAYLYRMANNLLHDHRRGRRRQQEREDHWTRSRIGQDLETDQTPSPEQRAIARDELARVNAAIASMPDRTAQILKMYRLDGMSQKAIATSLNLSLSAVEKHLQRAYHKLILVRGELDDGFQTQAPRKEADDVSAS